MTLDINPYVRNFGEYCIHKAILKPNGIFVIFFIVSIELRMLQDERCNKGSDGKSVCKVAGGNWLGPSRREIKYNNLVEMDDDLQFENENIVTRCSNKIVYSVEQRDIMRNGNNKRSGLSMGNKGMSNREKMVWEKECGKLGQKDTRNKEYGDFRECKDSVEQLHRNVWNKRRDCARDRRVLLATNYAEADARDLKRTVHVTKCMQECEDNSAEGITRQLHRCVCVWFDQDTQDMPAGTHEMGKTDTAKLLFAWHLAAVDCGIEHKWSELLCSLLQTKNWDNKQLTLLKLLEYEMGKIDIRRSDVFCYEYEDTWCAESINSCFCRHIPYDKLRQLLCDIGDEYVLKILIDCHVHTKDLVCLSLGSFPSNSDGICRALAAKETIAIMCKMGLLATAQVIVHFDNHNCTVVTILVSQSELDIVQLGFMTQLDASCRIPHLHSTIESIGKVLTLATTFEHADWRMLSAFAIIVARCCDHSGVELGKSRICSIMPVPRAWAEKGRFIVQAIHTVLANNSYFSDSLQLCANLLLDIKEDGCLDRPTTSCKRAVSKEKMSNFLEQLFSRAFGPRQKNDHHAITRRWLVLVNPVKSISVPSGSEHAFICCALTSHTRLTLPYNIARYIEVDNVFDERIKLLKHKHRVTINHSTAYDMDRVLAEPDGHANSTKLPQPHIHQQTGNWQTQVAPAAKRTCFMPFSLTCR